MKLRIGILLILLFNTALLNAAQYVAGDLAPRGNPDGQLNVADLLVLTQLVNGAITATPTEEIVGDVGPLNSADGVLDVRDMLILQRAVLGKVTLSPVVIPPPAPTLNAASSTTTPNPYQITGIAAPGLIVNLFVNGVAQQSVTSNAIDGTFSIDAYLYDGINSIHTTAFDGTDTSQNSNEINVQYNNTISRVQGGNIPQGTVVVWTPGTPAQPYIISSDLIIESGAKLILQPGTEIKFNRASPQRKLIVNGELIAQGSLNDGFVYFTSNEANPNKQDWQGIQVNSGANVLLDYVVIEYAIDGITFRNASGTIKNSRIENSYNAGIVMNDSSPVITNNQIRNNYAGLSIQKNSSPNITLNTIESNTSGVVLTGDRFNVLNNPTPTISNNSILTNNINLSASNYTNAPNIELDLSRNWWGSNEISSISSSINDFSSLIFSDTNDRPVVNFIPYLDSANGDPVQIGNYLNGPIKDHVVIPAGSVYSLVGSVLVPDGLSLTVEAGAVLQVADGHRIRVKGDLISQGTPASNISFTSLNTNKQPGNWYGIQFESTSINSVLDNMNVEFSENGVREESVSIDVTNSTFQFNKLSGVYLSRSSPNITSNLFLSNGKNTINLYSPGSGYALSIQAGSSPVITNNTLQNNRTGIYVYGNQVLVDNPNPVVTNNSIFSESTFDTYYSASLFANAAQTNLNASNNWWGSTDIIEISARIKDNTDDPSAAVVDFTPFLDGANGVPVPGNFLIGTLTIDTLLLADTTYVVLGDLIVPAGKTLTVQPGATLRFVDNAALLVDGNIILQGSSTNKILLDSFVKNNPLINEWSGIQVNSTATNVIIDHVIIQHASTGIAFDNANGSVSNSLIRQNYIGIRLVDASPSISTNEIVSNGGSGIEIRNFSAPVIDNGNKIIGNKDGIVVYGDYTSTPNVYPVVTGNSIYDNWDKNYITASCYTSPKPYVLSAVNNWWGTTDAYLIEQKIQHKGANVNCAEIDYSGYLESETGPVSVNDFIIISGTLTQDTILLPNTKYLVTSWLIVPQGITLTIPQGAELIFAGFANNRIKVEGTLNVQGVVSNPVKFSSAKDFPSSTLNFPSIDLRQSEWYGIQIENTAVNVVIDNAVIENANRGVYFNYGSGILQNSLLRNNIHGVYISGAQPVQLLNNVITNNRYGIYLDGSISDPQPVITNNDIYANYFGNDNNLYLYNFESSSSLNLSNNWWGTSDSVSIWYTINSNSIDVTTVVNLGVIGTQSNGLLPLTGSLYNTVTLTEQYISPTVSPGVKDSVKFVAGLVEPANWVVQVRNSAGGTVRSFSGSASSISVTWDGRNESLLPVADGVYYFYATVNTATRYYGAVVVDNTLPVSTISSPVENANINSLPYLQIFGTASDKNLLDYQISYANSFTQVGSNYVQPVIVLKTAATINSLLHSWQLYNKSTGFQVQPGNKTLRVVVTDKAGNSSVFYKQLVLDYPGISDVSHSPKTINPLKNEISTIKFTAGTPGTLTLKIYPESGGAIIYQSTQTLPAAGDYTVPWDGKTTAGDYISDEAYKFELELSDGINTIVYSEVDNRYNSIYFQTYYNFSITKNKFFRYNFITRGFTRVGLKLQTAVSNQHIHTVYSGVPFEEISNWLYWDGRDATGAPVNSFNTKYVVSSSGAFLDPSSIIVTGTKPFISGGGAIPDISIKPSSYKVRYSYDEISVINYQIDQDAMVTIKLLPPGVYDPADASAIIIEPANLKLAEISAGVPNVHSFTWKGYEELDTNNILTSEEGRYTFTIEATGVETGNVSLYRGNLNLFK